LGIVAVYLEAVDAGWYFTILLQLRIVSRRFVCI